MLLLIFDATQKLEATVFKARFVNLEVQFNLALFLRALNYRLLRAKYEFINHEFSFKNLSVFHNKETNYLRS
jgi:hypothetical protein